MYGANMSRAVREAQQDLIAGCRPDGIIGESYVGWRSWNEIAQDGHRDQHPGGRARGYALRSGEISLGVYMMQKYLSEIAQCNHSSAPDPHRRQRWHPDGARRWSSSSICYDLAIDGVDRHADLGCHRQRTKPPDEPIAYQPHQPNRGAWRKAVRNRDSLFFFAMLW